MKRFPIMASILPILTLIFGAGLNAHTLAQSVSGSTSFVHTLGCKLDDNQSEGDPVTGHDDANFDITSMWAGAPQAPSTTYHYDVFEIKAYVTGYVYQTTDVVAYTNTYTVSLNDDDKASSVQNYDAFLINLQPQTSTFSEEFSYYVRTGENTWLHGHEMDPTFVLKKVFWHVRFRDNFTSSDGLSSIPGDNDYDFIYQY